MRPAFLIGTFAVTAVLACSSSHGGTDAAGDTSPRPDAVADTGAPPPLLSYNMCVVTSDCVLRQTECCQSCDRWTTADVAAVNGTRASAYHDEVACPGDPPPCPRCAALPNPNLVATCEDTSRCQVIDIENDPTYAGCTTDADCAITAPVCCQCGADTSPTNLVAVRVGAPLSQALCDPMTACLECEPVYPPGARAICDISLGLCRVVFDFEP